MNNSKFIQIYDFYSHLKHPEKYKGNRPVTLRSSYEIKMSIWLDKNPSIKEWAVESIIIPYIKPTDGKVHRYFMDFNFTVVDKDGIEKEYWVEVKPLNQTIPPKEPKRKTKTYFEQVKTFLINTAKWETTKALVEQKKKQGKNLEFFIITEKTLDTFQ